MEDYRTSFSVPEEVFAELREWAVRLAPCRVPDQPKFGRKPHTIVIAIDEAQQLVARVFLNDVPNYAIGRLKLS